MPDGIVVVDKPEGWTSTKCVSLIRRLFGLKRVGHAGTLDPFATGVLPVCVGRATRVVEYLHDSRKTYVATLRLGIETSTGDTEGEAVSKADAAGVVRADLEAALARFTGPILQEPPAFSALKLGGVPAYERARRGEEVVLEPRRVEVFEISVEGFTPPAVVLRVECGRGTYIRSLARDIGRALGCGAHLVALRRTAVGRLDAPVSPEELERAADGGTLANYLLPLDVGLAGHPAALLGAASEDDLVHGRRLYFDATATVQRCVAYSEGGVALGILDREDGAWRPRVVFSAGTNA